MTLDQVTVGQLASAAGVRADTIRYYERTGLLPRARRTEGDHRRYGPADLDRLLFIRGAQRLGLRLAEIRDLLAVRDTGACPCEPAEVLLRLARRRDRPGDHAAHRAARAANRHAHRDARPHLPRSRTGNLVRARLRGSGRR